LLSTGSEDLVVPGLVLAELDYWCRKLNLQAAWLPFFDDVEAGAWRVVWPTAVDLRRARRLEIQYADLGLGIVDATVIALAERLGELKVATLDQRHFNAVRSTHVPALRLLPEHPLTS
jgi:predicted nucleic acid-binding protein